MKIPSATALSLAHFLHLPPIEWKKKNLQAFTGSESPRLELLKKVPERISITSKFVYKKSKIFPSRYHIESNSDILKNISPLTQRIDMIVWPINKI